MRARVCMVCVCVCVCVCVRACVYSVHTRNVTNVCVYVRISKSNTSLENLALLMSNLTSLHNPIIWSSSFNRIMIVFNILSLASLGLTVDNISLKKRSLIGTCSLNIPIVVTWSSGKLSSKIGWYFFSSERTVNCLTDNN